VSFALAFLLLVSKFLFEVHDLYVSVSDVSVVGFEKYEMVARLSAHWNFNTLSEQIQTIVYGKYSSWSEGVLIQGHGLFLSLPRCMDETTVKIKVALLLHQIRNQILSKRQRQPSLL